MSTAFLFPGQGTQRVGMGIGLTRVDSVIGETLRCASDLMGVDVVGLSSHGPSEELDSVRAAQCVVVAWDLALWRYASVRVSADVVAGHSVGELAAIAAAGVLTMEQVFEAVRTRAELMASVPARGTMTSIDGLAGDQIGELLDQVGDVEIALCNSEQLYVVGGSEERIAELERLAQHYGARHIRRLKVANAFHTRYMAPAEQRWRQVVEALPLATPKIPIVIGSTGICTTDIAEIRDGLASQLTTTVDWAAVMRTLRTRAVTSVVEVGVSKFLATLTRRHPAFADATSLIDGPSVARWARRVESEQSSELAGNRI